MTTTEPLTDLRRERAQHPEWTVRDERTWALDHGLRLRFDTLPAPTYAAPATAPGVTVVYDLHGMHCHDCGRPSSRMLLLPSGLIAVEHDEPTGSRSCAMGGVR